MNSDLISRSELKEAIRKRLGISSLKYLTEQEKVIVEEIDNVPTVNIPQSKWSEGFHEGFKAGTRLAEAFNEDTPYKDAYDKTLEEMKKECQSMTKPMEYLYYGECLGTFEQTFNKHLREAENETDN